MNVSMCLPLRLLPACLFAFFTICPSAQAQESTLNGVAADIAQQLKMAEKKHFSPQLLVIDFSSRPGGIRTLGEYFANQLSDALTQRIGSTAVVDRKKFHSYLLTGGISPFDLADREIAMWIAGEIGANSIVFGTVTQLGGELVLTTDLIRIGDNKQIGSSKTNLPISDQLKEMVSRPLDWPASPDVVVPCLSGSPEEMRNAFNAVGVTMPMCIHCPQPTYTDQARAAKFQGTVKFEVVVDKQGIAKRITTVKGDRNGLATQSMAVIREWKFKPAMKDGVPVTACVLVEATFKLF